MFVTNIVFWRRLFLARSKYIEDYNNKKKQEWGALSSLLEPDAKTFNRAGNQFCLKRSYKLHSLHSS